MKRSILLCIIAWIAIRDPSVQATTIQQLQKLIANDTEANDHFGSEVSLSGNTALIGAYQNSFNGVDSGSAYVFRDDGAGNWNRIDKFTANDAASGDHFGWSTSLSGDMALVNAYRHDHVGVNSGAAYLFEDDGTGNWNQIAKLTANDAATGDEFGYRVSLSGNTALVGTWRDDDAGSDSGSAYLFREDSAGNWIQIAKLIASDASPGDFFGRNVSLDGNTALVGSTFDDDNGTDSGSAYIFQDDGAGNWSQIAKLTASDAAPGDVFGRSVSIRGDTALVGAFADDSADAGVDSGSAYIFQDDGTGHWNQIAKLTANDAAEGDRFGRGVSLGDDVAIVGAYWEEDNGTRAGAAYLFQNDSQGNWVQTAKFIANDGQPHDFFGRRVSLSGNQVIVGSYLDDDAGGDSGSAYIFELDLTEPLLADFDTDGDVDGDDFLLWQSSFQFNSGGDSDGDGDTDGDDFLVWQSQFGAGSGFEASALPESSALLSGVLLASLAGVGRRR